MPIFHFNLSNAHREEDAEGTELADANEARVQAVVFAGAYLRDNPELVWDGQHFAVDVTDDQGKRVFAVSVEAHEE